MPTWVSCDKRTHVWRQAPPSKSSTVTVTDFNECISKTHTVPSSPTQPSDPSTTRCHTATGARRQGQRRRCDGPRLRRRRRRWLRPRPPPGAACTGRPVANTSRRRPRGRTARLDAPPDHRRRAHAQHTPHRRHPTAPRAAPRRAPLQLHQTLSLDPPIFLVREACYINPVHLAISTSDTAHSHTPVARHSTQRLRRTAPILRNMLATTFIRLGIKLARPWRRQGFHQDRRVKCARG